MSDAGFEGRQPCQNLRLLVCRTKVPHKVVIRKVGVVERIGVMRVVSVAGGAGITMISIGVRHFIAGYDVVGV